MGAVFFLTLSAAPALSAPLPDCGSANEDGSVNLGTLELELVNGRSPSATGPAISYEDKRGARRLLLEFKVDGCQFPASAIGSDIDIESITGSTDDGVDLNARVSASNRVKGPGVLAVSFAVDPSDRGASPGTYATGLVVTDPSFNLYRQPVHVTLQYHNRILFILMCLVPIYFVGTFLVYYKGRAAGSTEKYLRWLVKVGNLLASLAGLAAAFFYIQNTTFADAVFGRDLFDNPVPLWFFQNEFVKTLVGAGGAFTTAVLGSSLLGDKVRGGTAPHNGEAAGSFAAN